MAGSEEARVVPKEIDPIVIVGAPIAVVFVVLVVLTGMLDNAIQKTPSLAPAKTMTGLQDHLEQLSDEDLAAYIRRDFHSMSDRGLSIIAGEPTTVPPPQRVRVKPGGGLTEFLASDQWLSWLLILLVGAFLLGLALLLVGVSLGTLVIASAISRGFALLFLVLVLLKFLGLLQLSWPWLLIALTVCGVIALIGEAR